MILRSALLNNLRKWNDVMETYLDGKFSYYTTMPTDAMQLFRDNAAETEAYGFARAEREFDVLGGRWLGGAFGVFFGAALGSIWGLATDSAVFEQPNGPCVVYMRGGCGR